MTRPLLWQNVKTELPQLRRIVFAFSSDWLESNNRMLRAPILVMRVKIGYGWRFLNVKGRVVSVDWWLPMVSLPPCGVIEAFKQKGGD